MTDYDPEIAGGDSRSPGASAWSRTVRASTPRTSASTSSCSSREAGFDPVGLVVGSSIFHIGFQVAGPTTSRELDVLSQAMYSARHLAMTRMEEEADQLGADGIVGVRLDIGRYEWGANMAEFIAIGTAVKHRDGVAAPRAQRPAVSERSVRTGVLDAAAHRPPPGGDGDGQLRLPRRAARPAADDGADGAQRRAAELHPGAVRRARAGHAAHADRGPGARRRGHRRRHRCRRRATVGAAT